jgi:hypothetical protein
MSGLPQEAKQQKQALQPMRRKPRQSETVQTGYILDQLPVARGKAKMGNRGQFY